MDSVTMPSGVEITGLGKEARCMVCHQGRESTVSVDEAVAGLEEDTVSEELRFLNIHYFAAAATRFGTEAKGAYEYAGKTYVGLFKHVPGFTGCTDCHSPHGLEVRVKACGGCHGGVATEEDLKAIRMSTPDYDGDGDATEGIYGEIVTIREALLKAIQAYATGTIKTGIVYDAHTYPYFFTDTNGNGVADEDEASYGNRYSTWTPRLLKAAYNYQFATKDPGAFAHNGKYVIQILYDSLEDIGGDVTEMVRP